MKTVQPRSQDAKPAMPLGARVCGVDVYARVMVRSWTMSVSTGGVRYETLQLAWLVATQIAYGSHLDISLLPYDMASLLP